MLDRGHLEDFERFNQYWDTKLKEFEVQAEQLIV